MALSASSSFLSGSITSHELKAPWISSVRLLDQRLVPSLPWDSYCRKLSVKPVCAELRRSDAVVPLAAPVVVPEVEDRVETEGYERLAK